MFIFHLNVNSLNIEIFISSHAHVSVWLPLLTLTTSKHRATKSWSLCWLSVTVLCIKILKLLFSKKHWQISHTNVEQRPSKRAD